MIPAVKAKLLDGKKGLIVGIANEQSIAWGCAKAFRALGAELAVIGFPGGRATLLETAPGVGVQDVLAATEAKLVVPSTVPQMSIQETHA